MKNSLKRFIYKPRMSGGLGIISTSKNKAQVTETNELTEMCQGVKKRLFVRERRKSSY